MKVLFILFLLCLSTLSAQFQNIKVSSDTSNQPNEVTIAINPTNTQVLAAGSNLKYFFSSDDGGLTWNEKTMSSTLGVYGDPSMAFDNNGNLFFAHLSNPVSSGYWIDRIVIQKSIDNGKTWSNGVGVGFDPPKNQDKEWLAVDRTNSNFSNNLYAAWTEFDKYGSSDPNDSSRILFSYSNDEGETWSTPVKVSDKGGNCIDSDSTVEGAVPAVGPSGEVYLSWSGPLGIMFDKSLDGGNTFGKDIFVTSQPGGWDFAVPGIYRANGMPITACDISNSNFRGNIYINWSDQRNGTDNTDVFFIKSTDGGNTWGKVKKVNNDTTTRHQFLSWMSVDPVTGFIYIVFYDRRNTTGVATDVYLARSTDGGDTFENFKISSSSFDPLSNVFFGDYINIDSYHKEIRPIWMRMDNGILSVYTAIISDSNLITGTDIVKNISKSYQLDQNYPNPFNPATTISYNLPQAVYVIITVYDVLGRVVKKLLNEDQSEGVHEINFDADNLTSGIYLYELRTPDFSERKKMILMK